MNTSPGKIALRPRIADGIVLAVLVVFTFLMPRLLPARSAGHLLEVRTPGAVLHLPLTEDGRHIISGPLGEAVLVVAGGRARLENAPCPLKICEGMGPIDETGEVIICLPNRIAVQVTGEREIDAVTR